MLQSLVQAHIIKHQQIAILTQRKPPLFKYNNNFPKQKRVNKLSSKCEICKSTQYLCIHHTQYSPKEKTIILCSACHAQIHAWMIHFDRGNTPILPGERGYIRKWTYQYNKKMPS